MFNCILYNKQLVFVLILPFGYQHVRGCLSTKRQPSFKAKGRRQRAEMKEAGKRQKADGRHERQKARHLRQPADSADEAEGKGQRAEMKGSREDGRRPAISAAGGFSGQSKPHPINKKSCPTINVGAAFLFYIGALRSLSNIQFINYLLKKPSIPI
jgi:hypothetical protein